MKWVTRASRPFAVRPDTRPTAGGLTALAPLSASCPSRRVLTRCGARSLLLGSAAVTRALISARAAGWVGERRAAPRPGPGVAQSPRWPATSPRRGTGAADPGLASTTGGVRHVHRGVLAEGHPVLTRGPLPGHPQQGALWGRPRSPTADLEIDIGMSPNADSFSIRVRLELPVRTVATVPSSLAIASAGRPRRSSSCPGGQVVTCALRGGASAAANGSSRCSASPSAFRSAAFSASASKKISDSERPPSAAGLMSGRRSPPGTPRRRPPASPGRHPPRSVDNSTEPPVNDVLPDEVIRIATREYAPFRPVGASRTSYWPEPPRRI